MKATITKANGTVFAFEGTSEEIEVLLKTLFPSTQSQYDKWICDQYDQWKSQYYVLRTTGVLGGGVASGGYIPMTGCGGQPNKL